MLPASLRTRAQHPSAPTLTVKTIKITSGFAVYYKYSFNTRDVSRLPAHTREVFFQPDRSSLASHPDRRGGFIRISRLPIMSAIEHQDIYEVWERDVFSTPYYRLVDIPQPSSSPPNPAPFF